MKHLLWLAFIGIFALLVSVRIVSHADPAIAISSAGQLQAIAQPNARIEMTALVLRSRKDARGNAILKLQLADLSQPTLIIPPTVGVTRPNAGATIHVVAGRLGNDAFTLQHREDLKMLTPASQKSGSKRERLDVMIRITGETSTGGLQAVLTDTHDQFVATALVLPDCVTEVTNGYSSLYGYYTEQHTFVVEDIL